MKKVRSNIILTGLVVILIVGVFLLFSSGEDTMSIDDSPKIIVFLGDSLTAGSGVDPDSSYPSLLQKRLDRLGWKFKTVNAGISGDTSTGGLGRLSGLMKDRIDVFVLALGTNDGLWGLSPEETKKNIETIIQKVKLAFPGVVVILAGPLVPPDMEKSYESQIRKVFPEVAEERDVHLIPFLLEGVAGNPQLNLPDGVHPNAEGYKIVADNVWGILRPILEQLEDSQS